MITSWKTVPQEINTDCNCFHRIFLCGNFPICFVHRATLRALPQALSMRRQIKTRVNALIEQKSRQIPTNCWNNFANDFSALYNETKAFTRKTIKNAELWYESMKEIEGHFGHGVGTYFKFLRFLFVLNFISMMLISMYVFCFEFYS